MATTHPSPLVEGPYATYDFPVTSILWAAVVVNFKTSTTDSKTEQKAYGVEVSTERTKIMTNSTNNIWADISMNGQKLEEMTSFKYPEQLCARMAPAQQKSASGLLQQWQQWSN